MCWFRRETARLPSKKNKYILSLEPEILRFFCGIPALVFLIERRRTADEEKEIDIMALTRKMLKAMGIEEDKIEQIIEAHAETVDGLKDDVQKYREAAEKLSGVEKELETLKTSGGDWKKKYEDEHSAFESYKSDVSAKETGAAKEAAYRALLTEVGIDPKRIDTVVRAEKAGFADLKIGEDGKFEEADKLTEAIKANWADFVQTISTTGIPVATPQVNTGGEPDLGSMSMADYIAARKKKG